MHLRTPARLAGRIFDRLRLGTARPHLAWWPGGRRAVLASFTSHAPCVPGMVSGAPCGGSGRTASRQLERSRDCPGAFQPWAISFLFHFPFSCSSLSSFPRPFCCREIALAQPESLGYWAAPSQGRGGAGGFQPCCPHGSAWRRALLGVASSIIPGGA